MIYLPWPSSTAADSHLLYVISTTLFGCVSKSIIPSITFEQRFHSLWIRQLGQHCWWPSQVWRAAILTMIGTVFPYISTGVGLPVALLILQPRKACFIEDWTLSFSPEQVVNLCFRWDNDRITEGSSTKTLCFYVCNSWHLYIYFLIVVHKTVDQRTQGECWRGHYLICQWASLVSIVVVSEGFLQFFHRAEINHYWLG